MNTPLQNRTAGTLTYTTAGLVILFFWLLFGDFAIAMRERSALPSVTELLRQHHASNLLMGLLKEGLPALIGLVLVPIVAFRSDRHRSPRGRRIPYLLIPTPIAALAMAGIGLCPSAGAALHSGLDDLSPGLDFCVLSLFSVCWLVFECMALVTMALFTALIADVVPKGLLGRFFGCFRIVSLSAGIVFQKFIFTLTDTHLQEIFLGIGIFYGVAFTVMCLMVKEGRYPDPAPEEGAAAHPLGFIANARTYFVECFSHAYYLWCFAAIAFGLLAPLPFNSFYQVYTASLGIPKQELGNLTSYAFAISIGLAFFIGWLVDTFTALKMVIFALAVYAATMGLGYVFIDGARGFGVIYMLHVVVSGIYFTSTASLPMMLLPLQRFSQFASASGIVTALSVMIVGPLQGRILDATGSNYQLTLLGSALFAAIALVLHLVVLAKHRERQRHDDVTRPESADVADLLRPSTP